MIHLLYRIKFVIETNHSPLQFSQMQRNTSKEIVV